MMKNYTGYMIVATLVSYLISVIFPPVLFLTAILAWLVPILMWRSLGKSALQQAFPTLIRDKFRSQISLLIQNKIIHSFLFMLTIKPSIIFLTSIYFLKS